MSLRRSKILILSGATIATLAVALWAGYIFCAIWLRTRCARELAERAEPLADVSLANPPDGNQTTNYPYLWVLGELVDRRNESLQRLEELQRPSIGIVLRHLLGHSQQEESTDLFLSQTINLSPSVSVSTVIGNAAAAVDVSNGDGSQSTNAEATDAQSSDLFLLNPTLRVSTSSGDSTTVVQASDEQSESTQQKSVALTITGSSAILAPPQKVNLAWSNPGSSTRAIANIVWDGDRTFRCHSVTDSAGEKVLVVTRPLPEPEPLLVNVMPHVSPSYEVLLIDQAGRIFSRSQIGVGRLLGKLTEPHGKADQLVFGTGVTMSPADGVSVVVGPTSICIVDGGQLKTIRTIDGNQ